MSDNTRSERSASITATISELLYTGRTESSPENTRYVCHTSTIPLCTTVDEQFILKDESSVEVSHSILYQPGLERDIDYRCCKKHCMYVSRFGRTTPEILRTNCPCGEISFTEFEGDDEVEKFLQPLCFLQVLKEMRYNFGYADSSACSTDVECCHNDYAANRSNRPRLDLQNVMFCQNSQSILDSRYSAPLRKTVSFDGWQNADTPTRIGDALETLYWFRKGVNDKCRKQLLDWSQSDFKKFKTCLEQTLHTINGLLCKKFLCFPCEMEGYVRLSKLTAEIFEQLIEDYMRPNDFANEATFENSVFMRMKISMKKVKQFFTSENRELRFSILDSIENSSVRSCKFSKFFQPCISRLRKRIANLDELDSDDYTQSIAWLTTFAGFSQTRSLGYLPPWIAELKRIAFRQVIGRERIQIPKEDLRWISVAIKKRQYAMGIEPLFLSMSGRERNRDFKEVINSIKIPLKPTASVRHTVFQGGKVEDARELLNIGMLANWKIPVRDLQEGFITEYLELSENTAADLPDFQGYLFWISVQIVLNWAGRKFRVYKEFVYELPGSESYEAELWNMKIVHISEPGKERNLTKTSSCLTWFLTVASKVSQCILSYNQDHRAGLVLSAQDWMHQRRVSSESYESDWMYDKNTRKRCSDVWNGFQDWTESTDFIPRQVGTATLHSYFTYVDFPRWYSDLIMVICAQNYTVSEYTHTEWVSGTTERQFYRGSVTEGFMMSMPLTKTILHLMHDINIETVHEMLRRNGVSIASHPGSMPFDPERNVAGVYSVLPSDIA